MYTSKLPTEVELIYEVMPCNSMRCSQEPIHSKHSCNYFREWGYYHSYDYLMEGPPHTPTIIQQSQYLGKASLLPEVLSGCRKSPIIAVGINPNLPAFWKNNRNSVYPLFDDYKQYAHYFRYRTTDKLEIPEDDYKKYGGGPSDDPFSDVELNIPLDEYGNKTIPTVLQHQTMYETYQELLDSFGTKMGWSNHNLKLGEDLSYGNMVACPSAKWTTKPDPNNPTLPPMTSKEKSEIVQTCFFEKKYFLKQLVQSLPKVILVFSQNTTDAFIGALKEDFVEGHPQKGESIEQLLKRVHRVCLGALPNGEKLISRVIFCPHITGNAPVFESARQMIIDELVEEGKNGNLTFNSKSGHLNRPYGSCSFCPMLEIGECQYKEELTPTFMRGLKKRLTTDTTEKEDKRNQVSMLGALKLSFNPDDWADLDK